MKTASSWRRHVALSAAVLAAVGGAWLLTLSPPTAPPAPEVAEHPTQAPDEHRPPPLGAAPPPETGSAPSGEVVATGLEHREVDSPEEIARAERAYSQRIADNIAHLELQAEIARQQGHPQRAELMERRVQGLERRLGEHEASIGSEDGDG